MTGYTDEELAQVVQAVNACGGNKAEAARSLGVHVDRVKRAIRRASERGMNGYAPVLEGYVAHSITSRAPDGSTVRQVREGGDPFVMPEGMVYDKMSILTDRDNNINATWHKLKTGVNEVSIVDAVRAAFDDYEPPVKVRPERATRDDIVTVIPLPDLHVGLLAWEEETGGNYDMHIARETMRRALTDLVESMPPSKHCLILGLGDLLHFDGYEPKTERSGNVLDTDSRYPKVLREALRLVKFAIDLCLTRHDHVEIRLLAGNHDTRAALAVALALSEGYEYESRVTVDDSPSYIWFRRYGKVLLGATHGDKAKPADMPLLMAVDAPHDWSASTRRRVFTGHIHHERLREIGGVIVETLRSPVAKDAWHSFEGYRAGRSVYGYTFWLDGSRMARQEFEI